jgi:hypothetical protein
MKKSLVLASLLLVGSSAMASDYFVGANIVNAESSATLSGTATYDGASYSGSISDSGRDTNINIKIGLNNIDNRIYIQTGKLYDDSNISYTSTTINYDKFLEKTSSGFTPFIGAHIGNGKFEILGYSQTGTEYGIQTGLLKTLENKKFQFEAGIRYTVASAKFTANESGTINGKTYTVNGTIEADDATALYVGLNYKF